MDSTTASTSATGQITATEFMMLAKQFAGASQAVRVPSWAWIDAVDAAPASPFGPPATGYLRASPLLIPARECPGAPPQIKYGDDASALSTGDDDDDGDDAALPSSAERPGRLELHIVHSESYRVPVLLLQGQQPDGSPWTPDELRAHLRRRDGADGGVTTLSGNVVTQLEHPVLCVPSCCVDPCETATLMKNLLSGAPEGDGRQLDYLSAWWSVLAPLVGVESRSAWYALSTPP